MSEDRTPPPKVYKIRRRHGLDRNEALLLAKTKPWWREGLEYFCVSGQSGYYVWKEPRD